MSFLKQKIRENLFEKEGEAFSEAFAFWNKMYFRYPFSVKYHSEGRQHAYRVQDRQGHILNIARQKRLYAYQNGIEDRVKKLAACYFMDRIPFQAGDAVIDCGANIGEVGMYFRFKNLDVSYFPIEPSADEAAACDLNHFGGARKTLRKALWNKNETLSFYNKNDSGDSSVFETDAYESVTKVEAVTLDSFCAENNISHIKWLKLEAEGAEPEVLAGAAGMLEKIDYISADCGFERGREARYTVPDVVNALVPHGFKLVDMAFDRIVCLFARCR